ncbi:hypothetical protein [Candidatus Nanohalococcus occultus]
MGIEPKEYYNDLGHEEWERSEELFVPHRTRKHLSIPRKTST